AHTTTRPLLVWANPAQAHPPQRTLLLPPRPPDMHLQHPTEQTPPMAPLTLHLPAHMSEDTPSSPASPIHPLTALPRLERASARKDGSFAHRRQTGSFFVNILI